MLVLDLNKSHVLFGNLLEILNTSAFLLTWQPLPGWISEHDPVTSPPPAGSDTVLMQPHSSYTTSLFSICCESRYRPNAETSSSNCYMGVQWKRRYAITKVGSFMEPITPLVVATSERCDSLRACEPPNTPLINRLLSPASAISAHNLVPLGLPLFFKTAAPSEWWELSHSA